MNSIRILKFSYDFGVGGDVFGDDGTGTDEGVFSDGYSGKNSRISSDGCSFFHSGFFKFEIFVF